MALLIPFLFLMMMAGAGICTFSSTQMEKRKLIPKWTNEEYKRELPEYKSWNRLHTLGYFIIGGSILALFILAFTAR